MYIQIDVELKLKPYKAPSHRSHKSKVTDVEVVCGFIDKVLIIDFLVLETYISPGFS